MYGDWQLTYPGTNYRFGTRDHTVRLVKWAFEADGYRTDDVDNPRRDQATTGLDFVEAGQLVIDVLIDFTAWPASIEECARLAWEARTEFARVWRADPVRTVSGAVAELIMGGEQGIEGRPRGVSWSDDYAGVGRITGKARFKPAGTGVFAVGGTNDGWHEQTVGLMPPQTVGIVAPLVAPISTALETTRRQAFEVGGVVPTYPIVSVRGPLTGGEVELAGGWRMALARTLRTSEVAVIDTRPGHEGMTINGVPTNLLTAGSVQLPDAVMAPGMQEISLRGTSLEGTATATVRWRDMKESA
ncbi:hypothetical protein ACXR2T_10595 [Leucobacter sp. HY1910]